MQAFIVQKCLHINMDFYIYIYLDTPPSYLTVV